MPKKITDVRMIHVMAHYNFKGITRDIVKTQLSIVLADPRICGYFIVDETANCERPHFQGYVRAIMSDTTLRNLVKTAFQELDMSGVNNDFTVSNVRKTEEQILRYLCKGSDSEPPVVAFKHAIDITEEQIKASWEECKEWRKTQKTLKQKRNPTQGAIVDQVYSWAKEQTLILERPKSEDASTMICQKLIEIYLDQKKSMNMFHMQSQLRWILCKLSDTYRDDLVRALKSSIEYK